MLDSQGKFKEAREKLKKLWDDNDRIENRFQEMIATFGPHFADVLPEVSGFGLCICYLLVEWMRPILLAAILISIDGELTQILAIFAIQQVHYFVQLQVFNVLDR